MIDAVAATYWDAICSGASEPVNGNTEHSALQVGAGLAAIPYLMRLELWRKALTMLEGAFIRSPSRTNAVAVIPPIQRIIDHEARATILLAAVLEAINLAAAETSMRRSLDAAVANSDYRLASAASARLVNLYRDTGRRSQPVEAIQADGISLS